MILKQLAIHSTQVIFLKEIVRRDGQMRFTWDGAREDVRGMVADLIQKQILCYQEHVTDPRQVSGPTYLVLTDVGRRVVAQIEEAERKKTTIQSETAEIKMPA
jgi:hypothetical protein